jgi:probable rRNA maturation factor
MIRIDVTNQQHTLRPNPRRLRAVIRAVLTGEGVERAQVSVALVTDATIHRINRQFLNHDQPTDVITFPLSDPADPVLVAELLLSTDTAQAAATARGHDAHDELCLYLIHGLLHLCGFDDHRPKDRKAMRAREAHYLKKLRISLRS